MGVEKAMAELKFSLVGIYQKKGLIFAQHERKVLVVLWPLLKSNRGSLSGLRSTSYKEKEDPNGQSINIKARADKKRQRRRKIVDEIAE